MVPTLDGASNHFLDLQEESSGTTVVRLIQFKRWKIYNIEKSMYSFISLNNVLPRNTCIQFYISCYNLCSVLWLMTKCD